MTDNSADPGEIELVAAALRADRGDVATLARVLGESLQDTLPPGMVDVERKRSLSDRMNGRPGAPVAVRATFPQCELELRQSAHGVTAEARQVVRGVVIARREVAVDEWVRTFAEQLTLLAQDNAAARDALGRLLGG